MSWLGDRFKAWFGGGDKTTTNVGQTTSSQTTFDPYISSAAQTVAGRVNELASKNFRPYGGQINAYGQGEYSPGFTQAQGALGQQLGRDFAGQTFDPSTAQGFIDQYRKAQEPARQDAMDRSAQQINQLRGSLGSAFGGSRGAILEGELQGNLSRTLGDLDSRAIQQGISQGFAAHQGNIQNQLAEGQLRQGAIGQLLGLGQQQYQMDQGGLDRLRDEYRYNQDTPIRHLGALSQALATVPRQTYTTGRTDQSQVQQTRKPWYRQLLGGDDDRGLLQDAASVAGFFK